MNHCPAHHQAWLDGHPQWTAEMLKNMSTIGFDIHHIDGNHLNNDLSNLVLIEHTDHMRLHNLGINRLVKRSMNECKRRQKKVKAITEPFQGEDGEWLYPLGWTGYKYPIGGH